MTEILPSPALHKAADEVLAQLLAPSLDDPYPLYDWLRDHTPVHFSAQLDAYVLTRYADCERVLRDAATFPGSDHESLMAMLPQARQYEAFRVLLTSLVGSNPPKHTRLRRLVGRAFTPRRVQSLRPEITRIAEQLLDDASERMRDGTVVDLHTTVSIPVPLRVVARLLGVPESDQQRLADLVPRMINVIDPSASPEALADADIAFHELGDYLSGLLNQRRAQPRDDLVSALVTARTEDNDRLSDDELRTMLFTLWAAGFETAATAMDIAVLTLLRFPEQASWLHDPHRALAFIDEVLRWDVAGQISTGFRFAAQDVDFGCAVVPQGSQVRLLFGAANRDPAMYRDPGQFDPARVGPPSLAFGTGIHHCLGVNLARLEMCIVLTELVRRLPGLRLAGEPVRRRSIPLRDFLSIPVMLTGSQ